MEKRICIYMSVKLTTHLHLVPTSRMRGAPPPLPNTPSWRDAQLKIARATLPLLYEKENIDHNLRIDLFVHKKMILTIKISKTIILPVLCVCT
jgi:hypothetical protein